MDNHFVQIDFDGELQLVEKEEQGESNCLNEGKPTYSGPEKRRRRRRQCSDRREQYRFTVAEHDRRSGDDQRKHGWEWDYTV